MTVSINVYTLVDITATGYIVNDSSKQREQQRNWETAQQLVNLRAACRIRAVPGMPKIVEVGPHQFGSRYTGQHRCWKFIFTIDQEYLHRNHDPLYYLKFDFDRVPINTGLDETAEFANTLFYTSGADTNVYFKIS
jgi:hypothetical protein